MNIEIDFIGGTHGHYLSFLINKLLLGDKIPLDHPFTDLGTAHSFSDLNMLVACGHWSAPNLNKKQWWVEGKPLTLSDNIIRITVEEEDQLPIIQLQFHRGGDRGCDPAFLQTNTYHKLKGRKIGLGDTMLADINIMYNNVDYNNADTVFSADCWEDALTQEGKLFCLDKQNPDCPKNILRDYFKNMFNQITPTNHNNGFQKCLRIYNPAWPNLAGKNIYHLPYQSFYDQTKFIAEINKIKEYFNLNFKSFNIENLHTTFLNKQPYKDSKEKVAIIISNILQNKDYKIHELDVIHEGYINSQIEKLIKIKLPIGPVNFPTTVNNLVKQYRLNK